jgi:hypothetical protein
MAEVIELSESLSPSLNTTIPPPPNSLKDIKEDLRKQSYPVILVWKIHYYNDNVSPQIDMGFNAILVRISNRFLLF